MIGKLLTIMAHPDDAELWAGGTIIKHSKLAESLILVESSSKVRKKEAIKSSKILSSKIMILPKITIELCTKVILEFKPDIVVTHGLDDFHPDHRRISEIVFSSVKDTYISKKFPRKLYTCDTYESQFINGIKNFTTIVDISNVFKIKIKALSIHQSQPVEYFADMAHRLGAMWGARIDKKWGEAFYSVPILGHLPSAEYL